MATGAKGGYKTLLQRGDGGSPEAFTTVAEVNDISGPEITKMIEDATSMDSPDGYVEKISLGLRDPGSVTFQVNLLNENTTHNNLLADLEADVTRNFRIVANGTTKAVTFAGHVEKISAAYPVKGKMVRDCSIAITGRPVKVTFP